MIAKVIADLQTIDNETAKKLVAIFLNTQSEVASDYYESTIFNTQDNYRKQIDYLNGQVVGAFNRKLVETPLVFSRGKDNPVFSSSKNQGVAFGLTLVDYRSSKPMVVTTVEFTGTKFSYTSIMFDTTTNTYVSSISKSKKCNDLSSLISFVNENLNLDIDKWINKY